MNFTQYITTDAQAQKELLDSISDERFCTLFDTGVGYLLNAHDFANTSDLEFYFVEDSETGQYVAYILDTGKDELGYTAKGLKPTREDLDRVYREALLSIGIGDDNV